MWITYEAGDTWDIEDGFHFAAYIELLGPLRQPEAGSPVPIVSPSSRATSPATQNNAGSRA